MRKGGSDHCQFWWEQPLDINAADLLATAADEGVLSDDSDLCCRRDLFVWGKLLW